MPCGELRIAAALREGFGPSVSEARRALLVGSFEERASAIVKLPRERHLAAALGASGREHVRESHLLPRLLMDELRLAATLA